MDGLLNVINLGLFFGIVYLFWYICTKNYGEANFEDDYDSVNSVLGIEICDQIMMVIIDFRNDDKQYIDPDGEITVCGTTVQLLNQKFGLDFSKFNDNKFYTIRELCEYIQEQE